MFEEFDTSALLKEYLEDAGGHLEKLDSSLIEMEKEAGDGVLDVDLVSDLLGALHTLKGNSGMMGFEALQQYVHNLEGVFKRLLEKGACPEDDLMQGLFDAAAVIRETLDAIEKDHKNPPRMADETMALVVLKELADKSGGEGGAAHGAVKTRSRKSESYKYIAEKSNVLKIDFERLDHLLNLAGELVIHRTKLTQVEKKVAESDVDKELAEELSDAASLINKAVTDLQEAIMKVRMLPIRHVFQRFPRMVRDLSREQGKEIRLSFKGEATELDKTVIDEIGEPLLHLIRNAVDHGIEGPQERTARGKAPAGEITLSASQEGNNIIITVGDDGGGIDRERLREKALQMFTREAVEQMGADNLLDVIFEPGFSTADKVTEVSGRGVGLDVVKKNVARLGGLVEAKTEKGKGTTFVIKLPLTLAIISALMVRTGTERYALPLASVIESLRLSAKDVHTMGNHEVIMLRDRVLPLVRLSDLFGADADEAKDRLYVVVVGRAEKRVGLVVDNLLGRQEIVIKALDDYVGESEGIAGATILGDGSVVLILDVAGLIERNLLRAEKRDGVLC